MTVNAYPRTENHGTKDNSKGRIPYAAVPIPQFLPKIFIMNDRGPLTPELGIGSRLISLYGENVGNPESIFYKHQNVLFTAVYRHGGFGMVQRLVDPNVANKKANVAIYVDILEDDIDVYKRHSDGSIVYDDDGDPVVDDDNSPFKGYRVKWIAEINNGKSEVGNLNIKDGTMKDSDDNKSTMYPIYEIRASDPGSFYNNLGFAFDAFTEAEVEKSTLENIKAFPLKFAFYKRQDAYSSPVVEQTVDGSPVVEIALKPNVKDPVSKQPLSITDFGNRYYTPEEYIETETPYVYQNNANTVLGKLYDKESQWRGKNIKTNEGTVNADIWYDFLSNIAPEDQKFMLNPHTFRTLSRVPYFGFVHDLDSAATADNQTDITLSKNIPVFLGNGVNGDISDKKYEELVRDEMVKYLDKNGPYYDPAVNVESVIVDTGFDYETKKSLVNFITTRKDTFLLLGTYTYSKDNKTLTLAEERAIGVALNSRCQLAIESDYYNTPVMRASIVGGSGKYPLITDNNKYPLVLELTEKMAQMMAAPHWDKEALFDKGEDDIIDSMINIEPRTIPEVMRQSLWGINLIYPQPLDRETYMFPALQTVYPDSTSVLNNLFTVMAIVKIYKVGYEAQRRFSGNVKMNDAQFLAGVDAFINSELDNAFADMFSVSASSELTDYDKATGFSWTTNVKISSSVMKTVMTLNVGAYRK